jgi:transketolase
LWSNEKIGGKDNVCFVIGLETIEDEFGKKIAPADLERLEKTYSSINRDSNSNNIKSVFFKDYGIVEFTASNISVPIRLNGTLKYTAVDFVKFEDILRQNKKAPMYYLDAYENVVYAK